MNNELRKNEIQKKKMLKKKKRKRFFGCPYKEILTPFFFFAFAQRV